MGFPVRAEQREGLGGQGDVPIFGALATMDLDLEARAVKIGDLKVQGFMESEAQAIDGGQVDLVVERGGGREEPLDFLHTEHGGEPMRDLRAYEREGSPIALADVLVEEADTTVAEAHGGGGEAIDVFAVEEGVLQLLCRDTVGGFVGELGQQADFPDVGFLRPCALATEVEGRDHVLT